VGRTADGEQFTLCVSELGVAFTWWKHLREDRLLSILAVRRGSELVAIAPLALRPRRFTRACPLPVLEFLGSGFVGSDYLDVIVRNGAETEACQP